MNMFHIVQWKITCNLHGMDKRSIKLTFLKIWFILEQPLKYVVHPFLPSFFALCVSFDKYFFIKLKMNVYKAISFFIVFYFFIFMFLFIQNLKIHKHCVMLLCKKEHASNTEQYFFIFSPYSVEKAKLY